MQIFNRVQTLRRALAEERAKGHTVAFVPTMGNLHEGHMQLVRLGRERCDLVVVSIFVNPLQFGLNEDWEQYPRTLEADIERLEAEDCAYLFHPAETEIYPNGMADQTRVVVPTMTDILCGASRPGHFEGVTTVVAKLFNIVQPDQAIFGIKDYQQLAVIRRMVEDLCIPVTIVPAAIAREDDGLAMSSRNRYISGEERSRVTVLYEALCRCRDQIASDGRRDFAALEQDAMRRIEGAGFRPDYVSICNARTLDRAAHDDCELVVLGAMYTEGARLIDNVTLTLG